MKISLILIFLPFFYCSCQIQNNQASPTKDFMYSDSVVTLVLSVPLNFQPVFDSAAIEQVIKNNELNRLSIPEGKVLFAFIDTINHFELLSIVYEKEQLMRQGYHLFSESNNIDDVVRAYKDQVKKRKKFDDYNKRIIIDIGINYADSSIIERSSHWIEGLGIVDKAGSPVMLYVESIFSKKRDCNIYFTLPLSSFEKSDSIISCYFKKSIIKELYFAK